MELLKKKLVLTQFFIEAIINYTTAFSLKYTGAIALTYRYIRISEVVKRSNHLPLVKVSSFDINAAMSIKVVAIERHELQGVLHYIAQVTQGSTPQCYHVCYQPVHCRDIKYIR